MIVGILGKVMLVMSAFLCLPLIVGICYGESQYLAFLIPIGVLIALGLICFFIGKTEDHNIYAKEGFIIVAISWIVMSAIGSLPFVISGEIPNFCL